MTIIIDTRWADGNPGPVPTRSQWRHDHWPDPQPGAFYLVHDDFDAIYVGSTIFPRRRFKTHAYNKAWWPEAVRIEVIWHSDQVEARRAEALALYRRSFKYSREKPYLRYLPTWTGR